MNIIRVEVSIYHLKWVLNVLNDHLIRNPQQKTKRLKETQLLAREPASEIHVNIGCACIAKRKKAQ